MVLVIALEIRDLMTAAWHAFQGTRTRTQSLQTAPQGSQRRSAPQAAPPRIPKGLAPSA
jgi:hypothetical protein